MHIYRIDIFEAAKKEGVILTPLQIATIAKSVNKSKNGDKLLVKRINQLK